MKSHCFKIGIGILSILWLANVSVFAFTDPAYVDSGDAKMGWYRDAKFGLFIHWGMYSVAGGYWGNDGTYATRFDGNPTNDVAIGGYAEWIMRNTPLPISEYVKMTNQFDWSSFDAQDYIDLCFASGQKYIVITAKHHEGFAMYRSQVSSYNICDSTPYGRSSGRDPLKELADACQATKTNGSPYEIKMGFYYSHDADWYEPDGGAFKYPLHPNLTNNPAAFQAYIDRKVKPQVQELLTRYGDIGVIWFDVPSVITAVQAADLRAFVQSISPNTIISGRIGHGYGDFVSTGDNGIIGAPVDYPWESCSTINSTWGYRLYDENWKTRDWMLEKFIKIISHGGNYLLNVGPQPNGAIPAGSLTPLTEMGDWIKGHAEALYNTDPTPYIGTRTVHHDWGYCTTKTNKLFLHVTYWPTNQLISVPLISNVVNSVKYGFDNAQTALPFSTTIDADGNNVLNITVPNEAPDLVDTILVVDCAGSDVVLHPFKHRYEPAQKKTTLKAKNFQAHGEKFQIIYDRTKDAISNWTANNGEYDSAVWAIDLPQPGIYNVKITYSVNAPRAGRDIDVKLGDGILTPFKTISTGNFNIYSTHDIGSVILPDGPQELEIHPRLNGDEPMQLKEVILTFESPIVPLAPGSKISLHQNNTYTGWSADFVVGDYTTADIIAAGGLNNDVSSVQVPTGYIVQLFKEDNFIGESLLLMADDADLADNGFNENISSLRVLLIGNETNAVPGNLILNPSFEEGLSVPADWIISGSCSRTSTKVQDGNASFRITAHGASAKQDITLESGVTYDISVYVDTSQLTGGRVVFDTFNKYDGAGQGQFVVNAGNGGWKKYTGSFTATNTGLTLRMFTDSTNFAGTAYFDSLSLVPRFAAPSTYTLLTSVSNGSISLSPAGGSYTSGTVVTVTATPSSGYTFGFWSGDLSGSVNPTNITMNGNQSVTANFNEMSTTATPIQHLDATISNSVAGSPVTQWTDQSGNQNHAVSAAGSVLYPSTSRSSSGLSGLDFGPAANSLQLVSSTNSQAWLDFTGAASTNGGFAVLVAFKCDAFLTNNWNDVIGNASAVSGFGMRYSQTGAIQAYLGGATVDRSAMPVQVGDTVVFAFNYNATNGLYTFWDSKNGSEITRSVVASNFSKATGVTLGRTDNVNRYFKGMVGEVKVFSTKLSGAEFQSERDALVAKWITGPQVSGYDVWAATNSIGAATADDDGDGRANLLEYAIGGNPKAGGDVDPVIVQTGQTPGYSYKQRNDDPGLTYVLQGCIDLVSPVWSNLNTVVVTNSTSGDYDQVTRPIPLNEVHLYIRLQVTSPE